ncbi:MAG: SurA N-terminal domain-containing protein [Chitinophagaceae bacterium]|nr:SurA N-terminal domain-containing protein [Chitinophagaceae bacterium]
MSIIQKIREKPGLIIGIIAFALISFILGDYFLSRNRGASRNSNSYIGSVNGTKIDLADFSNKLALTEENYSQQGTPVTEEMKQYITEQLWNQEVDDILMKEEYEKLGLTFSSADLNEALYGANANPSMVQRFTDPKTGAFDVNAARQYINSLKKKKATDKERMQMEQFIDYLINNGLRTKYTFLISGSVFYPKWLNDKDVNDQNSIASVNYVMAPYASINDSTIKVTDEDIDNYISKHKSEFKQEKSRTISYLVFDAAPSAADTATVREAVAKLKQPFTEAKDAAQYVAANNSSTPYFDGFVTKSQLKVPNADSIQNIPVGSVYGPYPDGGNFVLARMVDKRQLADSVKCRHVLIGTKDENGQQIISDSIASIRIDSIKNAINGGASWAAMVEKYNPVSDGSRQNKGEMTFSSLQIQGQNFAKEFGKFILFDGKKGERKVVKTDFGYHYIEIMDQMGIQPAVKVAYYSKPIESGEETINSASTAATQFAAEARDAKSFEATAQKKKLSPRIAEVKPNDYQVIGLGAARKLIKWTYENKVGSVSEPESLGDKYVVVLISEEKQEGTPKAKDVRMQVENVVRNYKKAQQIIGKIGNSKDMNAIAKSFNTTVSRADSLSFLAPFIPGIGAESKFTGAAFDAINKGKVIGPIAGNSGVFFVQNLSIGLKPAVDADYKARRQQMEQSQKGNLGYKFVESLRKSATIKDNRVDFF